MTKNWQATLKQTIEDWSESVEQVRTLSFAIEQLVTDEKQNSYEEGLLRGSEFGDRIAKTTLDHADLDMARWQKDRLELVKELNVLREKVNAMILVANDHTVVRLNLSTKLIYADQVIKESIDRADDYADSYISQPIREYWKNK